MRNLPMTSLPTLTAALLALALPAFAADGQPGAHFIENWDIDGDGAVTPQEIEARRGDVFLAFDADENGALDAEEYSYFDTARANGMKQANEGQGGGGPLKRAAEGMTLAFNDTNGDGAVSRTEFLARSGAWMDLLDRDGDGQVTRADFGRK